MSSFQFQNSFSSHISPISEYTNFYENHQQFLALPNGTEPMENHQMEQQVDDSPDSGAGTLTDEEENSGGNGFEGSADLSRTANRKSAKGDGGNGQRIERPKECVVCGKAATCCHFDVPSCLGCRSFFRRSVLSQRQYQCHKLSQCRIDKGQTCRACRFDRCILGGMNLRAIKSFENDKELQKLAEDLERRRQFLLKMNGGKFNAGENGEMGAIECSSNIQQNNCQKFLLSSEDSMATCLLNSLKYSDEKLTRIRYSQSTMENPSYYGLRSLTDILLGVENILAKAEQFSEKRTPQLTLLAHKGMLGTPDGHGPGGCRKPKWLFIDSFLCLEMIKTLPAIQQLSLEGKISLLSSNALAAVVFSQSFYSIFANNDYFTFPDGFSPLCFPQVSDRMAGMTRKLFFHNLEPFKRIGLSLEEFLLLRVILLLQTVSIELPETDKNAVQKELENYSKILMQFERQRLGNAAGVQRYAELIFFLETAIKVANEHRSLLMNLMLFHKNQSLLEHPDFMDNVILGVNMR